MSTSAEFPPETVIADTVRWLERAVIGLNLCPFAKGVHTKGQIHYVVSEATDARGLLEDLQRELEALAEISPEKRDLVFAKFQRGEHGGEKGHGLGLTIARYFLDLHGGRILIDGRRNRGSTFLIGLPLPHQG